ncbi:MAG: outer spore coat protein CotE [Turicibacter sp.]|nr:outer spore coat protein CotE [Turicibacter sp.]
MNDIREIVTKAVIGKGRRTFDIPVRMPQVKGEIGRVLGAFITNHQLKATKSKDEVNVAGHYDVHVWYTNSDEIESDIVRLKVDYSERVELVDALRYHLLESDEIAVEALVAPFATDVGIEAGTITVDVSFEIGIEVIGETKMRVAILGPVIEQRSEPKLTFEANASSDDDDLSEIDAALNPDFLEAIIEPFE